MGIGIYIALMAFLTLVTLKKPYFAFVGVLCMFGLEQWGTIYVPYLRNHGAFANIYILVLLLTAVALNTQRFQRGDPVRHFRIRTLCILLLVYTFVTISWTPMPGRAYSDWSTAGIYMLAIVGGTPLLLSKLSDFEFAFRDFARYSGVLMLLFATVPDWGQRSLTVVDSGVATAGSDESGSPLALAQLAGLTIIVAAIYMGRTGKSIAVAVAICLASLVVLIKTGTRGQLIFSLVALFFALPFLWRKITVVHLLMLGGVVAVMTGVTVFIFSLVAEDASVAGRWSMDLILSASLHRFDNAVLLLGHAFESPFTIMFGLGNKASYSVLPVYPHVVSAEVLAEEGVIGFLMLVAIVWFAVSNALRLRRQSRRNNPRQQRVVAATIGGFVFLFLISFKQGTLSNVPLLFLFAVLTERLTLVLQTESRRARKAAISRMRAREAHESGDADYPLEHGRARLMR